MRLKDKERLMEKYGHSKISYGVHLLGRYIKDLYHPPRQKCLLVGKDNIVPFIPEGCDIEVYGNNNIIEIDPSIKVWNGSITIADRATPVHNCLVRIGGGALLMGR